MKIKYLLIPLICCFSLSATAEDSLSYSRMSLEAKKLFEEEKYRTAKINIIKVSPSLHGLAFRGASIGYETGFGVWPMSMYLNLRYFHGMDNSFSDKLAVEPHLRLEMQPRFWLMSYMRGVFVAPVADIYSNGSVSGGGIFGYQHFLTDFLTLEGFVGIQSSNKVENVEGPFFLKYGLDVGIAF